MSPQSSTARTLVAIVAALVMSTVAVSAAVAPGQAFARPVTSSIGANLNA